MMDSINLKRIVLRNISPQNVYAKGSTYPLNLRMQEEMNGRGKKNGRRSYAKTETRELWVSVKRDDTESQVTTLGL